LQIGGGPYIRKRQVIAAGQRPYTELKNLFVWNKTNGRMGNQLTHYQRSDLARAWPLAVLYSPHETPSGHGEHAPPDRAHPLAERADPTESRTAESSAQRPATRALGAGARR